MAIARMLEGPCLPAGGMMSRLVAPIYSDTGPASIGPFVVLAHALPATIEPGLVAR